MPEAEKKGRNFTFRSRGDMHERLSEAAAATGRSISEEIEARLAQSFEAESKMAAFRQEWEQRIQDQREVAEQIRKDLNASKAEVQELNEQAKVQMAEQSAVLRSLERDLDRYAASANVIDALMGENEASRDLIRRISFELMSNPEWDGNEADRKAIADRIHSYIYPPEIFGSRI
ncbi:Arc family DNA-binding protein [Bradyrhizobium sp. GCM10023182]|uniref:Arc family DNA-binding protein n=1 Tax=Bradyrhizobium zhengyangense TaxID=2911009 RepID=A0ABS9LFZ6_9BRAD|nr:Arc family DNA-binding protein [Bradyrhizobium zhengyangense]